MQPETFNDYWLKKDMMDFDIPVEIHLHSHKYVRENNNFKVLMNFCEPHPFRDITNHETILHQDKFDLILDFDEEILSKCKNSRLMTFGTTWIKDQPPKYKNYEVSFLCGGKTITKGHRQRIELFKKQKEIRCPHTFWTSSNFPLFGKFDNPKLDAELSSKINLFNASHHIVIENVNQNNWFTEKLIDSFITKTIPIYLGCPNISNYFNIDGIRHFSEINEIINFLNNDLDCRFDYNLNLQAIEENYELAKEYARPIEKRMQEKINEYISNGR